MIRDKKVQVTALALSIKKAQCNLMWGLFYCLHKVLPDLIRIVL